MKKATMPKTEDVHPNDLLNAKKASAADEYYRFKLRRDKLAALGQPDFLDAGELAALQSISTKEKVELKTLARLYQLDDNSSEYQQVKAITGGDTREEIAAKLTEKYLEKIQVENVLDRFIAPTTNKRRVNNAIAASRNAYNAFGNAL